MTVPNPDRVGGSPGAAAAGGAAGAAVGTSNQGALGGQGAGGALAVVANGGAGTSTETDGGPANTSACIDGTCSDRLDVVGGEFLMGCTSDDPDCRTIEQPEHPASVSSFTLDAFEATVARFREYVEAFPPPPIDGDGAHARIPNSGWQSEWNVDLAQSRDELIDALSCASVREDTWSPTPGPSDPLPITCVSWLDAFAFCIWDGGRLPTEAEWEYAASGGDEERRYPWGDGEPTLEHASFNCLLPGESLCPENRRVAVGSFAMGSARWGHFDLAGNVAEWVFDHHDPLTYASREECNDCAFIDSGNRATRGGSFVDDPDELRAASRGQSGGHLARNEFVGFRCARN